MIDIGWLVKAVLFDDADHSQKVVHTSQEEDIRLVPDVNPYDRPDVALIAFLN